MFRIWLEASCRTMTKRKRGNTGLRTDWKMEETIRDIQCEEVCYLHALFYISICLLTKNHARCHREQVISVNNASNSLPYTIILYSWTHLRTPQGQVGRVKQCKWLQLQEDLHQHHLFTYQQIKKHIHLQSTFPLHHLTFIHKQQA